MKTPRFVALSRAWLRKTVRSNRDVDVGISGPKLKLSFKPDEPIETREGADAADKRPFYESDATTLFNWYHGYVNTPEYVDNVLYVDVVPLRTAALNGIVSNAIRSEELIVSIEPTSYRIPETLKAHADAAVNLFKRMKKLRYLEGKKEWENNTSLRVISIDSSGVVSCQKARYFDQVGTNITLDWASGVLGNGWRTIRIDPEHPINGKLRSLRESNMANTLGVAAMLYDRDLSPIIRVRTDTLASIPKRGLHCTASGVHEVEPSQPSGRFDFSILARGMIKEIKHEIGLDEHEYSLFPVAFARELPRGGKPQLFFVAVARVSAERIREAMASADEAYEYVDSTDTLSAVEISSELFTYEGWACLKFAERFIEANNASLAQLAGQDA